jgi:hypothetical protein
LAAKEPLAIKEPLVVGTAAFGVGAVNLVVVRTLKDLVNTQELMVPVGSSVIAIQQGFNS